MHGYASLYLEAAAAATAARISNSNNNSNNYNKNSTHCIKTDAAQCRVDLKTSCISVLPEFWAKKSAEWFAENKSQIWRRKKGWPGSTAKWAATATSGSIKYLFTYMSSFTRIINSCSVYFFSIYIDIDVPSIELSIDICDYSSHATKHNTARVVWERTHKSGRESVCMCVCRQESVSNSCSWCCSTCVCVCKRLQVHAKQFLAKVLCTCVSVCVCWILREKRERACGCCDGDRDRDCSQLFARSLKRVST